MEELKHEKPNSDHTTIEMMGADRPGLFSEISAALSDLHCRVVEAHAWTHNSCLACVAHVSDQQTDAQINDPERLAAIEDHLTSVLGATTISIFSETHMVIREEQPRTPGLHSGHVDCLVTDSERRLHRLMISAGDFDGSYSLTSSKPIPTTEHVSVEDCKEKGYLIISIKCRDRPKLMFDCVCTLTDMQYLIFHASGSLCDGCAFQVRVST